MIHTAANIPGIDIDALTPRHVCIKRRRSHNLKVKLLVVDLNNETIRVQREKDPDTREYHARDLLSIHVKYPRPGNHVLAITFLSGMEIELFEANQKEYPLLDAFRGELLGYFGDFVHAANFEAARVTCKNEKTLYAR
ncbi:MAG: hypothetical protein Q6370_022695 [Candidatus Sigynarchaeota archaeon]